MHSKPFAFIAAGAIAVSLAAGCNKGSDQSSSSTTTTTTSSAPAAASSTSAASAQGDPAHGKSIFTANCSSCHGATGTEGGVGPSLKNEKSRKNYAQTIAWIKNPQPPMPKLYPSPLSEKDVDDVAAYVQSL
jgi:ubiquinol-cytochrome c reductase cytochrome c subunit